MKTLLILGTGADQVKGIIKAKEMGLYTIGLDINEFSDGAKLVDEFYRVNIKDIDETADFVQKYDKQIDGVIAFGVDIPYILAKAAELLNIHYYTNSDFARISCNKLFAKDLMKKNRVNLPKYKKIENFEQLQEAVKEFGYTCVLKPVDNSGARGVLRLTEQVDLNWAFENSLSFSNNKTLILEKFLDGIQLSTESFIIDGKVYTVGIAERNYEFLEKFSPYIIENGGDLPPASLDLTAKLLSKIDEQINLAAEAFGVRNGIIKGDLVVKNDDVYIIEVALRLSGGHLSSTEIPLNTDVDFLKNAISLALAEKIDPNELKYKNNNFVSLRYIFPYKAGKIKKLRFPEWFKDEESIKDYGFYYKLGEVANYPVKSHPERLGFFLISSKDRSKVRKIVKQIYKDTIVEIE